MSSSAGQKGGVSRDGARGKRQDQSRRFHPFKKREKLGRKTRRGGGGKNSGKVLGDGRRRRPCYGTGCRNAAMVWAEISRERGASGVFEHLRSSERHYYIFYSYGGAVTFSLKGRDNTVKRWRNSN